MKIFFLISFFFILLCACEYGKEISQDDEEAAKLIRIDTIYHDGDPYAKTLTWQFLRDHEKRQCRVPLEDGRTVGMIERRSRPFTGLRAQIIQ